MNAVGQQVAGILATNDIDFRGPDEDDTLFVRVDSAVLQIDSQAGETPSVSLRAWLLTDLDLDAAREAAIVEHLNTLNDEWLFPKFVLYPHLATIAIEYDLFAHDLDGDAFLAVLFHLGSMADDHDDELKREFGGVRAIEADDDAIDALAADAVTDAPPSADQTASRWRKLMSGLGE